VPAIVETSDPPRVIATGEFLNPTRRVAGHGGDLARAASLADEPEDLQMGASDRIMLLPIEVRQLLGRVVRHEPQRLWHNPELYHRIPYESS
jgi:hypothetical protein